MVIHRIVRPGVDTDYFAPPDRPPARNSDEILFLGHPASPDDPEALLHGRIGRHCPTLEGGASLPEDPGSAVRAAGDHDSGAPGVLAHPQRILAGPDVAISDDRDLLLVDVVHRRISAEDGAVMDECHDLVALDHLLNQRPMAVWVGTVVGDRVLHRMAVDPALRIHG